MSSCCEFNLNVMYCICKNKNITTPTKPQTTIVLQNCNTFHSNVVPLDVDEVDVPNTVLPCPIVISLVLFDDMVVVVMDWYHFFFWYP